MKNSSKQSQNLGKICGSISARFWPPAFLWQDSGEKHSRIPGKFRLPGISLPGENLAFNCVTGCAPNSLTDQFIQCADILTQTTRNSQKLQIPFLKSATGQRSFYYRTVKIWNALDPSLKRSRTLQEFKRKLQNILLKDFMDRTT